MHERLRLREKIAYSFGDMASSMFWKLFSLFALFFYTDIVGLNAAMVGTLLLITRVADSVNDPIMGAICDRTQSRWGKFRPYLLFGAIPFALIGMLTFTTPDVGPTGKLIYAYVTYGIMMMVYTTVNVPYAALMGVMTPNTEERTSLASWRFIGAYAGGILVTATAGSLIEYFGRGGNVGTGYQTTVALYAVVACVLFLLTFAGTRERLRPSLVKTPSLRDDLRDLLTNGPWLLMLGACGSILLYNTMRDAAILYYFKYFIGDRSVWFFGELSVNALSSVFMSTLLCANMVGVVLATPVAGMVGKKQTLILSGVVTAVLSIGFFFVHPSQVILIFVVNIMIGVSGGIVFPLIWAMYADVADYSEWRSGRRATGLVFSSSSMSQKMGWTIGGAVTGWILGWFGFEANMVQTDTALLGIRLLISVFAAVGALLSVAFIYFYPLSEHRMATISADLEHIRGAPDD